jgi:hypothetical protein
MERLKRKLGPLFCAPANQAVQASAPQEPVATVIQNGAKD